MNPEEWRPRLLRVTSATFEARGHDGTSHWARTGKGRVAVEPTGPSTVEWEERGEWTEGAGPFGYRTRLRWEFAGDELRLSHLRRGADAPVHLTTLCLDEHGALIPRAPHSCGHDSYLAEVRFDDRGLVLTWHATGPAKDYRLVTTYR